MQSKFLKIRIFMNNKNIYLTIQAFLMLFAGMLLFSNCKTDGDKKGSDTIKQDTITGHVSVNKVEFSMPSPSDIAALLVDNTEMTFNQSFLNKPTNADKYNTDLKVALNLGIYTCDMSYASYFEQMQVSQEYYGVTKKMAEQLGIVNIMSEKHVKMITESKITKASMTDIINETFMNTDAYLQENDRKDVMTTILYGGWIEALYLATGSTNGSPTAKPELTMRIADQAIVLEILDNLILNSKDENVKKLQPDLELVKANYAKINEKMSPENFKAFCNVIKELRTKYTV